MIFSAVCTCTKGTLFLGPIFGGERPLYYRQEKRLVFQSRHFRYTAHIAYPVGATPLIIPIGHQLDTLTNVLGDFVEVTATAATLHPVVTVVDANGKPTGKTYPFELYDHFSIAGRLENGVLANIFWRMGYASTEGRRQFIWEIEGEEGVIRMESNSQLGALPGMVEPDLYLNGKKIDIGEHGGPIESVGVVFKEFAEGGSRPVSYATIEYAIKHKRLLNAIEESAREGKRIVL